MKNLLTVYGSHYRQLISLGVPIVVGQIGNVVLGFADTLMVGHHGMKELAAASFVNSMFVLFVVFALGFSYGLTPIVGSLFGRGEHGKIGGVIRCGVAANLMVAGIMLVLLAAFYCCIGLMGQPDELLPLMRPYLLVNIASVPFICLLNTFKQFFDAVGHTKTPMTVLVCGNVLNILGNYLLIYGALGLPELGLLGAGISTLLSRVAMAVALVAIFFLNRRYSVYAEGFKHGRVEAEGFRHVCSLGWPLSLQMGMEAASFSLTAVFVGWIGSMALAAHQVMLTISQLFYMVYYGMAAAVAVRVSHFYGQRDIAAVRHTAAAGFHLILVVAVCVSIPIFLLRGHISYVFTDSRAVCSLVAQTVIPLIIYQFFDGMQCTYANALRGISCVRPMMYVAFFSYFVVSLPLSWLLGIRLGFGLVGVWAAFPVCLMCAGVLYYLCFRRSTGSRNEKLKMKN